MDTWFDLHLSPERARTMNREGYYAARSWLRRVRHILHLRYAGATVTQDGVVMIPATDVVLPEKFK